jgi:ATP-dependent DNA ligase
VRLLSRKGTDYAHRYPWIAEAALKNRQKHLVVDGEAVVLGVDGTSDYNALHSRKHDHEAVLRLRHPRLRRRRPAPAAHAESKPRAATRTPTGSRF